MNLGLMIGGLVGVLILWSGYDGAGSTKGATFMILLGIGLVAYGILDRLKK